MKLFLRILCLTFSGCISLTSGIAQCSSGYTATAINWDAMAFLQEGTYVSAAIAQNQKFAFGKNQLTITHNYNSANTFGDNTDHTGSAGSSMDGADVQFRGNGIINLSFAAAVQDVRFSLYDIDLGQRVTVTALNGGTSKIVTLTSASGTEFPGSGTTVASATATTAAVANSSSDGTVNVRIDGLVTSVRIEITQTATKTNGPADSRENGDFWLSDITACAVTDPFPTAYRNVAQPLTNQPGYILIARNNIVYMTDPATGRSVEVFRDPSNQNINSMGYDPYNRILYFTNSLTGTGGSANAGNKTIKKYDFNTETLSVLVADVTAALGIPTFGSGVESGGASFYDGALYLGIEGTSSTRSTIWRIDFDAALNPVSAKQVFGIALSGHDWGDFVVSNGILYDFDGASNSNENVFHVDLQTGAFSASYPAPFGIRQVAVDWTEKIFNIGGAPASAGEVVPYNNNGTVDATQFRNISVGTSTPSGSWGDAAEAFRPKVDFGDAPDSYDPDPMSPAFHELDTALRFGPTVRTEWNKLSTTNTDDDDNGLTWVPILNQGGGVYQTDVRVYNNTGSDATVGGWIDFNGNGVFDHNEGVTVNVTSRPEMQVVSLYWTGISYNLPNNSSTYLRIRVTSAAYGMTRLNPTGYYANGEVEDWHMLVNATTLPVALNSFSVKNWDTDKAKITWTASEQKNEIQYELQRSTDGVQWTTIHKQSGGQQPQHAGYSFIDKFPGKPISYYRLKYTEVNRASQYSTVQQLTFGSTVKLMLYPNPSSDIINMHINAGKKENAQLYITDVNGKVAYLQKIQVQQGFNELSVPVPHLPSGIYQLTIVSPSGKNTQKLIIQK